MEREVRLVSTITTRMTADEFLEIEDNGLELVDGVVAEKPLGTTSAIVGMRLSSRLNLFVEGQALGYVLGPEAMYRIWPDRPNHIRKPDISFIARDRLSAEQLTAGTISVRPDLAVEVISPGDRMLDFSQKFLDYAEAGIPLIWVVYPETRIVHVYRGGRETKVLRDGDMLDGEDVVPGFSVPVTEILLPRG